MLHGLQEAVKGSLGDCIDLNGIAALIYAEYVYYITTTLRNTCVEQARSFSVC